MALLLEGGNQGSLGLQGIVCGQNSKATLFVEDLLAQGEVRLLD